MKVRGPRVYGTADGMTDPEILLTVEILLAAHIVALALAVFGKRGILPLLPVNLLIAVIVLIVIGARGHHLFAPFDWPQLGLAATECAVIAISIAAWRRLRGFRALSCGIFSLHLLATIGALLFMATFSITRLI